MARGPFKMKGFSGFGKGTGKDQANPARLTPGTKPKRDKAAPKKSGAPHITTFGQNTTYDEMEAVDRHNKGHRSGKWADDHTLASGEGKGVMASDAMDKETNQTTVANLQKKEMEEKKAKKRREAVDEMVKKATTPNIPTKKVSPTKIYSKAKGKRTEY